MASKKTNDILAEQRRAREEFLRLKKMQSGEIPTDPKPSEEAILPKTPEEKIKNFWFHYKWHTIGIIATLVILTVLVAQCVNKPKYDYEIVYFSYTQVLDEQLDSMEEYFETLGSDLDGDGEVNVQIVNCSVSNDKSNYNYRNTILTKLQAMIAADEKAMLFITDKDSYKYFEEGNIDIFDGEPLPLGDEFYEKAAKSDFGILTDGLQISIRKVSGTTLGKNNDAEFYYDESKKIMENLK